MGAVDYVVTLGQAMELVPVRRGWWVAFGAPTLRARASAAAAPPQSRPSATPVPDPTQRPTRR